MKKITLFTVTILCGFESFACDICGCGVGSNYIGILPEFQKNIAGFRYRYNSLQTHLGPDGNPTYLTANEKYQALELWSAWSIGKKIRLMPVIPFAFNERTNQGITRSKQGLGDISATGFYQLLNKKTNVFTSKLLVQTLWIGGGVKLPTGKYVAADKQDASQNANLFQLGTGSTDFTLNAMYDIRLQDAGLNMSTGYKMNTTNKHDYRYGNKWTGSAQVYYKFRFKNKWNIAPNAGISGESSQKDNDGDYTVDISGGNILMGTVGMETMLGRIAIGSNWQTPLSQTLANGAVKAGNRWMAHVSFVF